MKSRLSKIDQLILGIGVLVIILVIVYAQFFSLSPLKSDVTLKEQSLKTEQKLLEVVTKNHSETTEAEPNDTSELQKELPVVPLQEQILLDLEKAETVSNSKIKSVGFSGEADVSLPDQANAESTEASAAESTETAEPSEVASGEEQASADTAAAQQPAIPEGLKKLTVQLTVDSPTYEDFEKFVETLEAFQRIMVVEAINYSGMEEVTSLDQEEKPLSFTLTVSAFYLPSLTDLESQVPKIDAPDPAGKVNPLSQFPSVTTQP